MYSEKTDTALYLMTAQINELHKINLVSSAVIFIISLMVLLHNGIFNTGRADKSLARPGRKQTTATEGFDVHISYL